MAYATCFFLCLFALVFNLLNAQQPYGVLDYSFGTSGTVTTDLGGSDIIRGMVVQPDGKTVAVGGNILVRYLTDGTLDPSFGIGGIVSGQPFTLTSVALQANGNIVACGFAPGLNGQSDFVVARFLSDGAPDLSFNATGRTMVSIAGNTEDIATCVALTPQGAILAGGHAKEPGEHERFALLQCLPNGQPDPTFGTGGKLRTDVGASRDLAHALAVQTDGKIVLAGQAGNGSHWDFAAVRYTQHGALDANFGTNGRVFVGFPGNVDDYCHGVRIDVKNRIVLGGKTGTNGGNFNMAVVRLLTAGALDPAFGTGGRTVLNTPSLDDHAGAVLLHPNGTIFLGGNADKRLVVAAFDTLGVPDAAFGASGVASADFGVPVNVLGQALALNPSGNITAAGAVNTTGNWDFALARFTCQPFTTAVFEQVGDFEARLLLYPNPATSYTQLEFGLRRPGDVRLEVRNGAGVLVREESIQAEEGRQTVRIELDPAWPAGLYRVVVATEADVQSAPMIKG